jgi:cysteine-S-conjugate beta-lyase
VTFDEVTDRRNSESYKWREYPSDVIPLFVADMDFRSPEPVAAALRQYVDAGVFGYPRGLHATDRAQLHELTGLVVERMQIRYGWTISPDAVVPIPGAVSGLNIACHALSALAATEGVKRSVLIQPPVYPQIFTAPAKAGVTREDSPLLRDANGRYSVDWDSFAPAAERAGMFILCNPHNPTGRVFTRDELERMAEICLAAGTIICADDMHSDLLFDDHEHIPIAALDDTVARRSITLTGPSKTFNLAGLQCAFAIIPDPDLRRAYRRFRNAVVPWVNVMGVIGAEAAYRHGQPWLDEVLRYLEANRDFLFDYVHRELPGVSMWKPEATYLAWLDCRSLGLENPCGFFLEHARVALSDGREFGAGGPGFVRLNFACPRSLLEEALSRMKSALAR